MGTLEQRGGLWSFLALKKKKKKACETGAVAQGHRAPGVAWKDGLETSSRGSWP